MALSGLKPISSFPFAFIAVIFVIFLLTAVISRRYHNPDASLEEGLATLKRCVDEVAKRLVVSPGKYKVKVVDKDGIREVEL